MSEHEEQKLDALLNDLFADARPDAKLEGRLLRRIRQAKTPRRYPAWMRFAIGAAAVVLLGGVGVVVQAVASGERLGVLRMASPVRDSREYVSNTKAKVTDDFSAVDVDPAATKFDSDIQYMNERLGEVSVPGAVNQNTALGIVDGEKTAPPVNLPAPGGFGKGGEMYGLGEPLNGAFYGRSGATGDWQMSLPEKKDQAEFAPPALGLVVRARDRTHTSITGGIVGGKTKRLEAGARVETEKREESDILKTQNRAVDETPYKKLAADWGRLPSLERGKSPTEESYFKPSDAPVNTPTIPAPKPSPASKNGAQPISVPEERILDVSKANDGPPGPGQEAPDGGGRPKDKSSTASSVASRDFIFQQPKTDPQPADAGLKIIRTGDMEFEVDSFDNAVKTVMALLKPIKGAFKLKEDSSKQANGKVRGHVVVRMPPQFLDDFVLDLRRDLAKVGELKLQQIGSQDVTKAYTDTESELKAARAVEKRLLAIIENGKGDVKDLVAAEKELGLWRMKIEKMEGEIRYYANQVALSTLTITLVEKEIQNAAALVVNETVKMRIEVDVVSKAREAAEKAVEEFKGRIVKSDEKQYPAGQVEAIVHAEIPPANKDAFRRALEKLGIVSSHEDTQSQTTEGGSFPVITPRRKVNDVLFQVTLNNIVNIKPKQSTKLDVVTADVRTNFEKLKDEIVRVFKGQIRDAKLDENQDKQKALAAIDFSVPTEKKAEMDKLIASIGPTLDRVNSQAAITEISTEQKFGYQLTLYSVAMVEPREKVRLHIKVKDVEAQSSAIADLVKEAKGQMARPKSGLDKAGQTEALLVITVPLVQADRLVREIKHQGQLVDWAQAPNTAVPDNELATAQIAVLLTGPSPIIPNDEGLSAYAQKSLYVSFTVFAYCILFIISGIAFLLPWVAVIWIGVWIVRRMRGKPAAVTAEGPKAG